jgi:hypothetical protein
MRSTITCILIGAITARRNLTFAICWKHGIFMFLGYVLGCWSESLWGPDEGWCLVVGGVEASSGKVLMVWILDA